MAQPPDISETFLREVDENLRRDRAARLRQELRQLDHRRSHSVPCRAAAGSSGGSSTRCSAPRGRSKSSPRSTRDIGTGNVAKAPQQLDKLADERQQGRSRLGSVHQRGARPAAERSQAGDREISRDRGRRRLAQPYRDAALIRQTALEFDQIKPDEVISRLAAVRQAGQSVVRNGRRNDRAGA